MHAAGGTAHAHVSACAAGGTAHGQRAAAPPTRSCTIAHVRPPMVAPRLYHTQWYVTMVCPSAKGLQRQRLIGLAVAEFNNDRTITKASATV